MAVTCLSCGRGREMVEIAQSAQHGLGGELEGPEADGLVALAGRVLDVVGERGVDLLRDCIEQADVLRPVSRSEESDADVPRLSKSR